MTISKTTEGTTMTLALEGRLDTTTSPELDTAFREAGPQAKTILDMKGLVYISSAGLRVLLSRQKAAATLGPLVLRNVCPDVMEVFEMTGFNDLLQIEA